MMKVNMKHVIEIAGGLVIGNAVGGLFNGVVNLTKKQIVKLQAKKS